MTVTPPGDTDPMKYERNKGRSCQACDRPARTKGYCRSHYDKFRRHGDPNHVAQRPLIERKECGRCGETKERSEFHSRGHGLRSLCKPCFTDANWERNLARKYGISVSEYRAMVQRQNGRCAVCDQPQRRFDVDHCHESGVIRGLLCRRCNLVLGNVHDDAALLRSAANYLERASALLC